MTNHNSEETTLTTTPVTADSPRIVHLYYRDLRIAYDIDMLSIAQIAEKYQIEWSDVKSALVSYGVTIRRNGETKPAAKGYTIVLADTDKIVKSTSKSEEKSED